MSDTPETSTRRPRLSEVLDRAFAAKGRRTPRAMPARVVKYDADKQRVDCQVLVQQVFYDEEDERQVESVAQIPAVPVVFPGGKKFRITFPISDGKLQIKGSTVPATTGLLVWCERSIDKWLSGDGREVDPEFDHQDGLADAVFYPGLNPFGAPLSDVPTDAMTMGIDGGLQIKIDGDYIIAGEKNAAQTQLVALANLVKQQLDSIQSELDAFVTAYGIHTHGVAIIGSTGVPNAGTHTNTYSAGEVAAKNLKAEQ